MFVFWIPFYGVANEWKKTERRLGKEREREIERVKLPCVGGGRGDEMCKIKSITIKLVVRSASAVAITKSKTKMYKSTHFAKYGSQRIVYALHFPSRNIV